VQVVYLLSYDEHMATAQLWFDQYEKVLLEPQFVARGKNVSARLNDDTTPALSGVVSLV
jgi:hypothetical protein